MLKLYLRGRKRWSCVCLFRASWKNTPQQVSPLTKFEQSALESLAHFSTLCFSRCGLMQFVSTRSHQPNSQMIVLLAGILPVINYVARGTLYSESKALTIAVDKRQLFFMWNEYNQWASSKGDESANISGGEEETKGIGLLYTRYFDFICLVESIFLANLMLKMMLAYNTGNIVAVIKTRILAHEGTKHRFSLLLGSNNKDDNQLLLGYILEIYANKWGTFLSSILGEIVELRFRNLPTARWQGQKVLMG
jgi:hypothetical protein